MSDQILSNSDAPITQHPNSQSDIHTFAEQLSNFCNDPQANRFRSLVRPDENLKTSTSIFDCGANVQQTVPEGENPKHKKNPDWPAIFVPEPPPRGCFPVPNIDVDDTNPKF